MIVVEFPSAEVFQDFLDEAEEAKYSLFKRGVN